MSCEELWIKPSQHFTGSKYQKREERRSRESDLENEYCSYPNGQKSIRTVSSQTSSQSAISCDQASIKLHGSNETVSMSENELSRTPVTRKKHKVYKRQQIPECQKFQDIQVILWLKNKEAEKREAIRKKRAVERKRRSEENATELDRKKRAELASVAYETWLQRKTRDAEMKKQPNDKSFINSDPVSTDSKSVHQGDTLSNMTEEHNTNELKNAYSVHNSQTRPEKRTNVSASPEVQSPTRRIIKSGAINYASKMSTSPVKRKSPRIIVSSSAIDTRAEPQVSKLVQASESVTQTVQGANPDGKGRLSRLAMTQTEWLRQKFYEAELIRLARQEARERLAMLERFDSKLIEKWAELLKTRCLELDRLYYRRKSRGSTSPSFQCGVPRRTLNGSRQTRTSRSESEVTSTHSLVSDGTNLVSRRRRFFLKLPSPTTQTIKYRRPHTAMEYTDIWPDSMVDEDKHPDSAVKQIVNFVRNDTTIEQTTDWNNEVTEIFE